MPRKALITLVRLCVVLVVFCAISPVSASPAAVPFHATQHLSPPPNITLAANPYETTQPGCGLTAGALPLNSYGAQEHRVMPTGNDERFVAGSGGCFDQYRNRNEVVDNRLTFHINH